MTLSGKDYSIFIHTKKAVKAIIEVVVTTLELSDTFCIL